MALTNLEEGFEHVRIGLGEQDECEEGAEAAVEHRRPDLGQRGGRASVQRGA